MSTPSEPTLTTDVEFPRNSGESKSSTRTTGSADNVGKDQHDVLKSGTVEQDTAGDDGLQGSLNAKIASEDHPAATSDEFSDTTNVVSDVDLSVPGPETPSPQGVDDGEVWIPKGPESGSRPTGAPTGQTPRPTRPKPKRGD